MDTFNSLEGSTMSLMVSQSDIVDAIKSFPAGSSCGIDGLKPQHLKDMIGLASGAVGQRLIFKLVEFTNLCLSGEIPDIVRPVFFGASLCALSKKNGGIRPIAVGCTLRRMVAKAACRLLRDRVVAKLAPVQLGFGVQHGSEAAVHAARTYLRDLAPGTALLKIDFSNAFNSLRRDVILDSIQKDFPGIFAFINSCYSSRSYLRFGQFNINSDEGVQQGDPLGPLLFCMATLSLVKQMKSELNIWYMDDGTLGGDAENLVTDFLTIINTGKELGLIVNPQKCEIITDDMVIVEKFKSLTPEIIHTSPSVATLLGAPIGSNQGTAVALFEKLKELKRLSENLQLLNAHDALFLLKNCFSIPKLTCTLRCTPCYDQELLSEYDDVIRSALQSILNISLSEEAWIQASLPVSNRGIGVRSAGHVALPAFLSSVESSNHLIQQLLPDRLRFRSGRNDPMFLEAVNVWETRSGMPSVQPPFATQQKFWDEPLVNVIRERVQQTAPDQAGKARLIAAAAPFSGAFLNARPCASLGTRMDDSSLRIAVALRLGAAVGSPHVCICGVKVDSSGRHGLSCRKSAGRSFRHSSVNDLIKRALATAEIPSRLEPTYLARTNNKNENKRPDGISLTPWHEGRCLVWDFTCPDTFAQSHLNKAVTGQGAVAIEAEDKKQLKYNYLAQMYNFVPVAIEL